MSTSAYRTFLSLVAEYRAADHSQLKDFEVFGYAAGSDKNRVAHGHPPRGNVIGPG